VPDISLDMEIHAPVERVWKAVVDIEAYPASMDSVRWVRVVEEDGPRLRRSAWSIVLKGSILEWEEQERLDPVAHVMGFDQVRGDLERFTGRWVLEEQRPGVTRVLLEISFEIGIPLLADMLNPVAQRSLRENCAEMLRGVEREAIGR
jgi:ribosome-associated toxin RatA of RatAB toxin-antitoxin module